MPSIPPKPRDDGTPASRFFRCVWDAIWGSGNIGSSPNMLVNQTTTGKTFIIKPTRGGTTNASTLNYRGTYAATETYEKGDIVRVMTGNSQGVWISVSVAPLINVPPVFPEPASTVTTPPSVNKWEIFALGIQMTNVCQNGNKVVYINATAPA